MLPFLKTFFQQDKKKSPQKKLKAATAKKVLQFLAHGLTYGIESLARHYQPSTKVSEFVAVSGSILGALKFPQAHLTDVIEISVHVNEAQKHIQLMQVGEHVMMTLDGCQTFISLTTLDEIYLRLRSDILKHEAIYGKKLQMTAASYPDFR